MSDNYSSQFAAVLKYISTAGVMLFATVCIGYADEPKEVDKLLLEPASTFVQKVTPVRASIRLGNANVIASSVTLLRYDAAGTLIATVSRLYDDGTHGDSSAGDHVFSTQVSINEPAPQALALRVSFATKGILKRTILKPVLFAVQSNGTPEQALLEVSTAMEDGNMERVLTHLRMSQHPVDAFQQLTSTELKQFAKELKQAILVRSRGRTREYNIPVDDNGQVVWLPLVMERTVLNEWFITVW